MSDQLKPPKLQPGDTIGVVSPASQVQVQRLEYGIEYLKKKGFKVELGDHIYDSYGYLAGPDKDRLNDLIAMFENPAIKAIISSRGGYGTPRLLDDIDYEKIRENPKIFVGYSDLTALQLAIWKHTRLVTFSGPMVAVEMGKGIDPFSEQYLWSLLYQDEQNDFYADVPDSSLEVMVPGNANGILLGGCLSLVSSLLGTRHQPDFANSILILEDIGEEPYRIDRYLSQFKYAGIFEQVKGIVLGQFVDCVDKEGDPTLTLDEIFYDYFHSLKVPVLKNFLYGHGPKKFTIPYGLEVSIETDSPKLTLTETAVRDSK